MLANLRRDLPASLVVFLVAVPLSLGIALASGAPLLAGVIGAVCGGIITGALAGSPLQVSGPAAGLTVVVAGFVAKFGWPVMCVITACAGLVQLTLGFCKLARTALMIAPAVVHGMLAGIGLTIALAQIHVVLGGSAKSSPLSNVLALWPQLQSINMSAALLGFMTIAVLMLWPTLKIKTLNLLPAALVAVTSATALSLWLHADVARVNLPDHFSFTPLALPEDIGGFVIAVITVALIASVESLLCAVATDKLHSGVRADFDRELTAQGAGNLVSGLLGGLPITGVIVRSSANINANAATRWSAIFHGVWILLFALFFSAVIDTIPLAILGGLLVHTGCKLVNLQHIRTLKQHNEALVFWVTLIGVLAFNLLEGVLIGLALSAFFVLRRISHVHITSAQRDGAWHVVVQGSLTFASVPSLSAELARLPARSTVFVDLAVDFIDHAAFEALHSWRLNHEMGGGRVDIDETHEEWYGPALQGTPGGRKQKIRKDAQ